MESFKDYSVTYFTAKGCFKPAKAYLKLSNAYFTNAKGSFTIAKALFINAKASFINDIGCFNFAIAYLINEVVWFKKEGLKLKKGESLFLSDFVSFKL